MARSLPERTVDVYLGIAVARRFPGAGIWDPTNTPGQWDHTILAAGKTILFEAKGNEAGHNDIVIDVHQLGQYVSSDIAPLVFYLLADPPGWTDARAPIAPGPPSTTWPNFPDWAFVIPAAALAKAIGLTGVSRTLRPSGGEFTIPATGSTISAVPLHTFFDEIEHCYWVAEHPGGETNLEPGRPGPSHPNLIVDGRELVPGDARPIQAEDRRTSRLTAIAVYLPIGQTSGDARESDPTRR